MKQITIILIISVLFLYFCTDYIISSKQDIEKSIIKACEQNYFEGQKDAINGDIRIKLNSDSIYYWIKSPHNDGHEPIFNPTYLNTKQ